MPDAFDESNRGAGETLLRSSGMNGDRLTNIAALWAAACIAALIGLTFRLYWFAYFWTDDFNNLYWVQRTTGQELLAHILNPASTFFRPVGMAFYWVLLKCCDLDPAAYHGVAWLIHAVNVGLLYAVLNRIVQCRFAAAIGASLFACRALFSDIYWSFGTIFELVATFLFLGAMYVHLTQRRTLRRDLGLLALYVLAVKSKEMAITLPVVLAINELFRPTENAPAMDRRVTIRSAATVGLLLIPAIWFALLKAQEMVSPDPASPYYVDISLTTLLSGYQWYFNRLLDAGFEWPVYAALAALLAGLSVYFREKLPGYFAAYAVITLLPVIFLPNHRFEFFWYLPFLGVSGFAAVLVKYASLAATRRVTPRTAAIASMVILPLVCRYIYFTEKDRSAQFRWYFENVSNEHRHFVQGLRSLQAPARGATLSFVSMPAHFDETVLVSATEVALRRTDIRAEYVSRNEAPRGYQLAFEDGVLISRASDRH